MFISFFFFSSLCTNYVSFIILIDIHLIFLTNEAVSNFISEHPAFIIPVKMSLWRAALL